MPAFPMRNYESYEEQLSNLRLSDNVFNIQ